MQKRAGHITKTAALILNGAYIPDKIEGEYILCADGGYNLLKKAGRVCDAVIGDLDSALDISPGTEILRFDKNKNETDGHLAVMRLCASGFNRINIYGAFGGRADQVAGNINLLPVAKALGAEAVIFDRDTIVYFTDGHLEFLCEKGDIISVLPFTGEAVFKKSEGLVYPLNGLTIPRLSSRGISNAAAADKVSVTLDKGSAFVYRIKLPVQ